MSERVSNWKLATELQCPKCHVFNLPAPASPTIEVDQYRAANCSNCGHGWTLKKEA